MISAPDYFQKKIDTLIAAYKDAAGRTRSVFMFINVSTALCIVVFINSFYFLFPTLLHEKHLIMNGNCIEVLSGSNEAISCSLCQRPDPNSESTKQASITASPHLDIHDNPDLKKDANGALSFISIPILGIQFHAFDLGSINAITMVILTTWFFFCSRRENQIINEVHRDIEIHKNMPGFVELADYVYQSIANQSVFSTATEKDFSEPDKKGRNKTNKMGRLLITLLLYAPAVSIFVVLVRDMCLCKSLWGHGNELTCALLRNVLVPVLALIYCLRQIIGTQKNDASKRAKLKEINDYTLTPGSEPRSH